MSIIFDPSAIPREQLTGCFSALFLTQQSYIHLLDLVDIYFKLGIRTADSTLPCLSQTYLYISSETSRLTRGVGKMASLKISHLGYDDRAGVIIALVILKNNFTDGKIPHIVISKPTSMTRADIRDTISGFKLVALHEPYIIHGKIGVMTGSKEELRIKPPSHVSKPSTFQVQTDDGHMVQINTQTVDKPELTLSVDNSPPPGDCSENQDTFHGVLIQRGRGGGRYIILPDGKKRYLTEAMIANAAKKDKQIIYNINLLAKN